MPTQVSQDQLREIVKRAQNGSGEDFQKFYSLYSKAVYNFIWRLIGSSEDAEDLTQDTFLKVHSELRNLREPTQFKFWLYRIARNEVYQKLRRSQKATEVPIDEGETSYHSLPASDALGIDPERQYLSQELQR